MRAALPSSGTPFRDVRTELADAGLSLVRAWPRSPGHLLLDVRRDGRPLAGQWYEDAAQAARTACRTPGATTTGRLVLQPDGADRRLPGLAALVTRPGSRLVGHRPERRAVVEVTDAAGHRFVKVVPPHKQPALLAAASRAAALPLRAPAVLTADPDGMVVTERLPGTTLTGWLSGSDGDAALTAVGATLARLHGVPPPVGLRDHDVAAELAVLTRWTALADAFGLDHGPTERVVVPAAPRRPVLVHRDMHDGQLLLAAGPDGPETGVLDFDLMALGDPALDLANLLVHLELRARQGVLADAAVASAVVLDAYRPDAAVRTALPFYAALARQRLHCVYGFRAADLVT